MRGMEAVRRVREAGSGVGAGMMRLTSPGVEKSRVPLLLKTERPLLVSVPA